MVRVGLLVLAITALLLAQGPNRRQKQTEAMTLSAAITVPEPIFQEGDTERLQIYFGVVNDGTSTGLQSAGTVESLLPGGRPGDALVRYFPRPARQTDGGDTGCRS